MREEEEGEREGGRERERGREVGRKGEREGGRNGGSGRKREREMNARALAPPAAIVVADPAACPIQAQLTDPGRIYTGTGRV